MGVPVCSERERELSHILLVELLSFVTIKDYTENIY